MEMFQAVSFNSIEWIPETTRVFGGVTGVAPFNSIEWIQDLREYFTRYVSEACLSIPLNGF